jgi:hypothetical protein
MNKYQYHGKYLIARVVEFRLEAFVWRLEQTDSITRSLKMVFQRFPLWLIEVQILDLGQSNQCSFSIVEIVGILR